MNFRVFLGAVPVSVFLGLQPLGDARIAVLGGFLASIVVFALARRDRLVGVLSATGIAIVTLAAVVGMVWSSERAYLAAGPISDFVFVPLHLVSLALGRPLAGQLVREIFPRRFQGLPVSNPVFARLSLGWAAFDLAHGLMLTVLLLRLEAVEFVAWSRIVGWPLTAGMILLSVVALRRAALTAGGPGQDTVGRKMAATLPG